MAYGKSRLAKWLIYTMARFASWLSGKVPRRVRIAVGGAVTLLVYYAWASKRRATIENMAVVLDTSPTDPRAVKLARDSWRDFGRYLSDFFWLPNSTKERIYRRTRDLSPAPGTFAILDEALARGKGVLLISAHFGAYDVAGVYVANHCPISIIVETFPDPRMDDLVQEQRRGLGMEVIRIEKTPRKILRELQANGVVAVTLDRPVSPEEGVPITFFGRRCYVPAGIAQLALKTGAAIVPGGCWYDEAFTDAYYVGAGPIIYPEPTGDKRGDTIRLMQQMYDALELYIRRRPSQWAMFRPFWPEWPELASTSDETRGELAASGDARGSVDG